MNLSIKYLHVQKAYLVNVLMIVHSLQVILIERKVIFVT